MSKESPETIEEVTKLQLTDFVMQLHIVVGPGGKCLCGVYDGTPLSCVQILTYKSDDVREAVKKVLLQEFLNGHTWPKT